MSRTLSSKPDLGQLKNQAKDVLKGHKRKDRAVCGTLRLLRKFAESSDRDILAEKLTLNEAQYALAMDYGFTSWNALVHNVEEATMSKPRGKPKRENGKVWIDGIPKLSWGVSGNCTYAGALAAALTVTNHPFTYSQIMGYTGLAFRVRWYRRTDINDWCPSSPVGEFPQEIDTTQRLTGWQFDVKERFGDPDPHRGQFTPEIVKSIDSGIPVLGHADDLDVAVVYGYQREGDQLRFLWNDYNKPEFVALDQSTLGPMIIILKGHSPGMEKVDRFISALTSPNWRRKSWTPENYPEKREHSYLYGDDALKTWIADIEKADSFTPEQREKLFFVGWWCFAALRDARDAAATFMIEHAGLLGEKCSKPLDKAAEIYGRLANMLAQPFRDRDVFLGPWTGKSINDWTPEVRRREIEILSEVRKHDAAAIFEIDRALETYKEK
ncbi:MAG: hypothetical protein JSU69_10975 [Candidatus Zixiibacteriota bacterium]|nr:MAG: hypothetical protein JSU69_10975 [candidate division Zixibacteria bacterium]